MTQSQVKLPAGYAPAFAVGFADGNGNMVLAGAGDPLPVTLGAGAIEIAPPESPPAPPPLSGTASASDLAGPFAPVAGRPVIVSLEGDWQGSVRLTRSIDGGTTRLALTAGGLPWGIYSDNICEPAWVESEENARLYLEITLTSGSISYRIAQ